MSLAQPSAVRDPRTRLRAARLDLFLWTGQVWLAMFFGAAGYAKLTEPAANLVALLGWPAHTSLAFVQGLGAAEVAVALGMILPGSSATGRRIVLICAAALTIAAATMLTVHAVRQEAGLAIVNGLLILLAGAVVWGRSRRVL
jgi:hypothetical protein